MSPVDLFSRRLRLGLIFYRKEHRLIAVECFDAHTEEGKTPMGYGMLRIRAVSYPFLIS